MSNPRKADDYLRLLSAASAYRNGEHIYARTIVDGMEDPLDDALHMIGVLMAASAAYAESARQRRGAGFYVARNVEIHPN
jgi:hypothetical protein